MARYQTQRNDRRLLGYMRISRKNWYREGGFSNPRCLRVTRGGHYIYLWEVC